MNSSKKVSDYRKRMKNLIVEAMGGGCQCCGYSKCNAALDLHHINPNEKEFSFSSIRSNPKRKIELIPELQKCILVCSNCHREIHSGVRVIPKVFKSLDLDIFLKEKIKKVIKKQKRAKKLSLSYEEALYQLNVIFVGNKSAMARKYEVSETAIRKFFKCKRGNDEQTG